MKEFHVAENGESKGPYSLKDLKYVTILPDTLIWKEGWADWKKAKDAVSEIPEIELIINDTPSTSAEKFDTPVKKKSLLTSVIKASEGDLDEIGNLLGAEDKTTNEREPVKKPSFISTFFSFIGQNIDSLIDRNQDKIGGNFFITYLSKSRNYYKTLGEARQRSLTFLISCFLVFVVLSLVLLSPTIAAIITIYWAGFVGLNQIKFIDDNFNKITDWVVLLSMGWLPKSVKRLIANLAKFLLFIIVLYFAGRIIGVGYIIYRIIVGFVNPESLLTFEQEE